MIDPYDHHVALQALRRIAGGAIYPHSIAESAIKIIGDTGPPVDPETIPGHQYATEAEHRAHIEATTVPAIARQDCPKEVIP